MSAVTASIGINSFSSGLIRKVTTSQKVTTKVLMTTTGDFGAAASIDPINEFTVEGSGTYPSVTLGIVASGNALLPSSISAGVIVIEKFTQTEKMDEYQEYSYSGHGYPGAS